jgi:hypothetical protein
MGRYWSVEECGWVEHTRAPEPEVVVVEQRPAPQDEEIGTLSTTS